MTFLIRLTRFPAEGYIDRGDDLSIMRPLYVEEIFLELEAGRKRIS